MISLIQDFEVDFLWKVSLKILNSGIILKTFTHVKYQCFRDSVYIHTSLLHLSLGGFLPKFNFLLTRLRETAENIMKER